MRSCHNSLIKSSSRALGSRVQRTPEQEGSCASRFRWEQGLNGRHGCVRDLMPSAQYCHFSLDHFFLSPYTVICFLLSHLCSFDFSCFLPSLPLKKESLSLLSFFSTHLCLYQLSPTFFPFLKIFHPSQTLSWTCLPPRPHLLLP